MARTKTEPAPSIMSGLPRLPDDDLNATSQQSSDVATQPIVDRSATEPTPAPGEPVKDAHATPSLIERLKSQAETDRQSAESAFTTLVARLARNEGDETEVAAVLQASGKSLAELETAVDHAKRIIGLKAIAADAPDADAAMRLARTAFRDLKERQKQQSKEMEAEFNAVRSALHSAERRSSRCQGAANDLARLSHVPVVPPPPEPARDYEVLERRYNGLVARNQGPISVAGRDQA